jgi:uncharacterized protein
MFSDNQLEEIVNFVSELNDNTKIYIGCDSVRKTDQQGNPIARFATVLVVHMNGNAGCRVWSHISIEPDFDKKRNRPSTRLMKEVYKVCDLYLQIAPLLDQFDIEVHLDINPDPKHGSNIVEKSAVGYVNGMTGVQPKLKPDAWCASFGADHFANGRMNSSNNV